MSFEIEQQRLVSWLEAKPAIVIHAVAAELNWDFASEVINVIVNNSRTDRATAALLFLKSCPTNHLPTKNKEGVWEANKFGGGSKISLLIAENWNAEKYSSGKVEFNPVESDEAAELRLIIEGERLHREQGRLPWPVMQGLEGPFKGEKPKRDVFEYFNSDIEEQFRLRAMLEDLGNGYFMSDQGEIDRFITWRVSNGFGKSASWNKG